MKKEDFANFVDLLDFATDVLKQGGSFNITTGPYLQGVSIEPTAPKPSPLPWLIVGGLGLTLLFVFLAGD